MKPVLLTDFGSTYTKLTAVDLDAARILGTAQSYTTVAEDVRIGFQKALDALLAQTGPLTFAQSFACSSAAGGLRIAGDFVSRRGGAMKPVLLTDFGSTYTKLTAVDLDAARILGTAQSYTTVAEDVRIGFQKALDALLAQTGPLTFVQSFACSSAAGGLRMMVSGLVPELTMEAARLASLGAGAKIVGQFSFELTQDDLETIQRVNPDIFLLVGGTDGGNSACVIHNAQMLATIRPQFPIVLAGNRTAMQQCRKALEGCEVSVCENVMPKFGVLKTEDTQKTIRSIFLRRIVQAKGLSAAAEQMSGPMMPTPAAVMQAMTLLAKGTDKTPGIGELIGVDVGGATTDVYSIAEGMPRQMNRVYKGLPEPYAKRTVEGDIGMRYSIEGVLAAAGAQRLAELSGLSPERVETLVQLLAHNTQTLPEHDTELERLDYAVASMAVQTAVTRHAGTLEETYTMLGQTFVQSGKNLCEVRKVVVTGGSLIHSQRARQIARFACYDPASPMSLRPKKADIILDKHYILAAMGLLSQREPEIALQIMKEEIN